MNTLRDLLNDLVLEVNDWNNTTHRSDSGDSLEDYAEKVVNDYLLRFKELLSNYLGEAK